MEEVKIQLGLEGWLKFKSEVGGKGPWDTREKENLGGGKVQSWVQGTRRPSPTGRGSMGHRAAQK